MAAERSCPEIETLQLLLGGQLSARQSEPLEQHVAECPRCAALLPGADLHCDPLVEALQSPLTTPDIPPELLQETLTRLSQLQPSWKKASTLPLQGEVERRRQADALHEAYVCLAPPQQPGEIGRLGTYRVLDVLGSGGMGLVLRAEDPQLRRPVALKVLRPGLAGAAARERFLREARAVASLAHDHIVAIHQVGEDGNVPYLAMEFLEGGTLADRLARSGKTAETPSAHNGQSNGQDPKVSSGRLSPREAVTLLVPVARAVYHAHQRGILHRDLKPGNILLDRKGRPHVSDFGLARDLADDSGLTQSGALVGTPSYMAPEQTHGQRADVTTAVDVYGLGGILYALLAGRPPFGGFTVLDTLEQVRTLEPERLGRINPDVDRDLETICHKCLEKEPARRYASARELAEDLGRWQTGEPILARPTGRCERGWRWCRRNPLVASLLAGTAVLLILVIASLTVGTILIAGERTEAQRQRDEAQTQRLLAQEHEQVNFQHLYAADMKLAHQAWKAADLGLMLSLLDRHVPRSDHPDLRGFEWHYLHRLYQKERRVFSGHKDEVYHVVFSPDGRMLATASRDRTVLLWDAGTGALVHTLRGHTDDVNWVEFSPDSQRVASASDDRTVRLWDVASGGLQRTLNGHSDAVVALAFAPDGQTLVSGGGDRVVRIWDVAGGRQRGQCPGHTERIESLAMSSGGKQFASAASDGTVRLWELATGRLLHTWDLGVRAYGVAFRPHSLTLAAACGDHSVRLFDCASGKQTALLVQNYPAAIQSVAFSPDGDTLVTGGDDDLVRLWDVASGTEFAALRGHFERVWSVAFSPDGKSICSAGRDHRVRLWDITQVRGRQLLPDTPQPVRAVAFTPNGQTLLTAGQAVRLWDAASRRPHADLQSSGPVVSLALTPNGTTLAAGTGRGQVRLWDMPGGQVRGDLPQQGATGIKVMFSPDGQTLATADGSNRLRFWDAATCEPKGELSLAPEPLQWFSWAPHDNALALISGDTIYLYDLAAGGMRWQVRWKWPHSLAFTPDGHSVVVTNTLGALWILDTALGKETATLLGHGPGEMAVAFSADGRTLATAGQDRLIRLWNLATGQELFPLDGSVNKPVALAFSPDGRVLVSAGVTAGGTGEVVLWLTDSSAASRNLP